MSEVLEMLLDGTFKMVKYGILKKKKQVSNSILTYAPYYGVKKHSKGYPR